MKKLGVDVSARAIARGIARRIAGASAPFSCRPFSRAANAAPRIRDWPSVCAGSYLALRAELACPPLNPAN
jgi:hypothetical protein